MTTTNISIIDFNAYVRLNKCTSVCQYIICCKDIGRKNILPGSGRLQHRFSICLGCCAVSSRSSKSNMAQLPLERGDKTKWVCNDQQSWLLLQRHGTRNIYIYIIYLNIQCTKANWSVLRTILIQSSVPSSISCRSSKIQKLILHG